ncbi:speckle-type POZ protein-like [Brevipalpus obovatus]|uniref:speckle-type POZ protein-like n=1 Tax=Brevipalpus obovatus TaxID=246614 RepID=UPI003D9E2EDD
MYLLEIIIVEMVIDGQYKCAKVKNYADLMSQIVPQSNDIDLMIDINESGMNTSQCCTQCIHVCFSHTWEIRNYDWFLMNRNRLRSSQFLCTDGEHSWYLVLYLKGSKEEYSDYLSIYLYYNSGPKGDRSVRASYEFSILDSTGNTVHTHRSKEEGYTFLLGNNLCNWGVHRFVKSREVRENQWITDDRLILKCDVVEMQEKNIVSDLSLITYPEEGLDLTTGFAEFLLKREFTDLVIEAGEKRLDAHKVILCSASKVFKSMFEACNYNENKESKIRIDDFDYEVVRAMVQFLYTQKIDRIDMFASELILIADKYDIQYLKRYCEAYLVGQITADNALKLLALAQHTNCSLLEARSIGFIAQNAKAVFANRDWTHFNSQDPASNVQQIESSIEPSGTDIKPIDLPQLK